MARAIWSGAISFGLVNIPIKLVTAVDRKNVSFREIRASDNSRVRHRKVSASDGEEVSPEEIVKGFEVASGRYVVVDPDELKALDPKASRTIDIEDFVELADIDPIHYDSSYYLVPGPTAAKPYELLRQAMEKTGKAAVARFVLRTKQHLAVLRALDGAIAVSTLVYHDEVVDPSRFEELPDEEVELSKRELTMATQLIESMTVDWQPARYEDDYRRQVLEMIEAKAEGQEPVTPPEEQETEGDVVDLMAALEASLSSKRGGDAETA